MNNEIYWVWLSKIEGLTPKDTKKLLDIFKNPENIWKANEKELKTSKLSEDVIKNILDIKYKRNLEKYLNYMKKNKIEIITMQSSNYPYKLRQIYDFPCVIYAKGNTKILQNEGFAIIGSRNCSKYGKEVSKKLAYELALNNKIVISGLARGIDSFAHIGSIEANGKTVAVLGNGLDMIYPFENTYLAEKILETGGLLISEYIVGTKPIPTNFPARNRIISGISNGVIVVEAKERSGTFITVDFALEQGKDIYAVPRKYYIKKFLWHK